MTKRTLRRRRGDVGAGSQDMVQGQNGPKGAGGGGERRQQQKTPENGRVRLLII